MGRGRVFLEKILETNVNYRYSAEKAELPVPRKHYETLYKKPDAVS
jgi:hypothetical protein